jgi:hypothetical protein
VLDLQLLLLGIGAETRLTPLVIVLADNARQRWGSAP